MATEKLNLQQQKIISLEAIREIKLKLYRVLFIFVQTSQFDTLPLQKILKNQLLSSYEGNKAEALQRFHNTSLYKFSFFIDVAQVLSLLWQP